jgi:hypothetical protein
MRPFASYISLGAFIAVATLVYCVTRLRIKQLTKKIAQTEQQITGVVVPGDDSFESVGEVFRLVSALSDLGYRKAFWLRLSGSLIRVGITTSIFLIISLWSYLH